VSNRNGHSTIIFNDRVIIFFDVLMCITIAVPTPYFKIFFSRQTLETNLLGKPIPSKTLF
jgi:hypothetical protein